MKKQIMLMVFSLIIIGFVFTGHALAVNNTYSGSTTVNQGEITSVNLGVTHVGTLPTSHFYFLKEFGRSIKRLFTFGSINKAKLELSITNQKAAELFEVEKGSLTKEGQGTLILDNALKNFIKGQERLNARLAKLTAINGNLQIADLTKKVEDSNGKYAMIISQGAALELDSDLKIEAENNILKTFTFTVTNTGGVASGTLNVKQKATDQIASAEEAIKKAETTYGQPVTFTANILKTTDKGTRLDIDGNGTADALTDGLMIIRYMFGLRGSTVVSSPTGGNSDTALDIDGSSKYDALTDGLLVIRYMFGLTGTSLASAPTSNKVHQSPNLLIPISGVNVTAKENPDGVVTTTSTDQNGSFEFTGLAAGKYDIFLAGEKVKSITVGTDGGIQRGRVIGLTTDPSDPSPSTYYIGSVNGGVWKSHTITATYNGDANYGAPSLTDQANGNVIMDAVILANAKSHLENAKEALAEGKYGEAYGQARSAEAMTSGIEVININEGTDYGYDMKTVPKQSPKVETPKVLPKVEPTPDKKDTSTLVPAPVCEHAAPPEGCYYKGTDVYPECSASLICPTPTVTPAATPAENPMGPKTLPVN